MRCLLVLCIACSSGRAPPADDGEATFRDVCARCHGAEGKGGVPVTAGGTAPRDLTDATWQTSVSDAQIETVIRTGKPPMPAFHAVLTSEQIKAVAAKVRRLGKGTAK